MMTEEDWQWETGTPHERGQIVRSFWGVAPKSNMTTLFNLTEEGLRCILDGGDWKPEYVEYQDGR